LGEPYIHWQGKQVPGHIRIFDPPKEFRRGTYGLYEPPRDILKSIPGINLVEMERIREYAWCCGAGGGVRGYDIVHALDITNEKLYNLEEAKVDALTDICPFCQLQFDRGQIEIQEKFGVSYGLPVLHYAELLGLAQGMSPQELGLDLHGISCEPFLQKVL
jgi:heterodisulfide reductase subunit B